MRVKGGKAQSSSYSLPSEQWDGGNFRVIFSWVLGRLFLLNPLSDDLLRYMHLSCKLYVTDFMTAFEVDISG